MVSFLWSFWYSSFDVLLIMFSFICYPSHVLNLLFCFSHSPFYILLLMFSFLHYPSHVVLLMIPFRCFLLLISILMHLYQYFKCAVTCQYSNYLLSWLKVTKVKVIFNLFFSVQQWHHNTCQKFFKYCFI